MPPAQRGLECFQSLWHFEMRLLRSLHPQSDRELKETPVVRPSAFAGIFGDSCWQASRGLQFLHHVVKARLKKIGADSKEAGECVFFLSAEVIELCIVRFLFMHFLATKCRFPPEGVVNHVEWLLRHDFKTPAEWLGEEGEKWRQRIGYRQRMAQKTIRGWQVFFAEHDGKSLSDIEALMEAYCSKEGKEARAA